MTLNDLTDTITELDADILDKYFTMKQSITEKKPLKKPARNSRLSIAACIAAVICTSALIMSLIKRNTLLYGTNGGQSREEHEVTINYSEHDHYDDENAVCETDAVTYPISPILADWPWYSTVGEIVDASTEIYTGKVTGISFEIIDPLTGKADRSPDSDTDRKLYTLYTVEVTDSCKGENASEKVIRMIGGLIGYNEEEQYELLNSTGLLKTYCGIPIFSGVHPLSIGVEYLFCTVSLNGDDYPINPKQFAYQIDSENAKSILKYLK